MPFACETSSRPIYNQFAIDMATFTLGQTRKALSEKGFSQVNNDHEYYHLYVNGKITSSYAKVSFRPNGDDLREYEARNMKASMGLDTVQQVKEFVRCTLRHEGLVNILRSNGKLLPPHPPKAPPIKASEIARRKKGK